ncbi:sigma-70 family RNA polymerase sigma factor [Rubellimicrobium thermophilum]
MPCGAQRFWPLWRGAADGGRWTTGWASTRPMTAGGPHEAASATGPRKGHPFRPSPSRPAMSEGMTDAASEGREGRLQAEDPWESLLRSANAGDARAFARFLVAVTPTIQGIVRARAHLLTREDRDDLVQEILIAIHLKRRSWQPDRPLRPWLHAVIRYKIIDALRRRSRQAQSRHLPIEDLDESLFCEDPADPSVPLDLDRILARIDERSAFIIRASALDGQQAADIGEQLALAEGTVRVLLHRALRKLSDLVQRTLP